MSRIVPWVALGLCLLPACKSRTRPSTAAPAAAGPLVVRCGARGCAPDRSGSAAAYDKLPQAEKAPAAAPSPARDGGELVVHVDAEPAILCDLVEHDAWSRWIVENQVVETLVQQDPGSGALEPRLAESLEVTASALTLHLRKNVQWHDGQPFGADDVLFTLERARDPAVGADQRGDLEPVSAIEAPDAATVVLRLQRPAPFLRQALAHIGILPAHLYRGRDLRRAPASRAPVGTGPFTFVEWVSGDRLVLARNPRYWGPKPHLDRVVFRVVRDRQVAYELYLRGQLDVLWSVPPARSAESFHEPRLAGHHMLVWTPRAYFFIVWNTARGRLGDARVRRALTLLTDRARFIAVAFGGHARPVTGPYVPGTASYDDAIQPWPYDPAAARKLLAEAGASGLKLTLLTTAGSRSVEQLATLLREDLRPAGVELEVASVDFAVQLDRLRRHAFDASALQWTVQLEQDNYTLFHSSQAAAGQNYGAWRSPAADALIERIRATPDDEARHALDRQLHRLVHDEQPYTFLAMREVQTLLAPRVHDLTPSQDGFDFAAAWVDAPAAPTAPTAAPTAAAGAPR